MMKMKKIVAQTIFLAVLFILQAGCGSADSSGDSNLTAPEDVQSYTWVLQAYGDAVLPEEKSWNEDITLVLDAETTDLSGFGGCSSYKGTYTAENGRLTVSALQLDGTPGYCVGPSFQPEFLELLSTARSMKREGTTLTVGCEGGQVLEFEIGSPVRTEIENIQSIVWNLVSYGDVSGPTAAVSESNATLIFTANSNSFSGYSGCNWYQGTYEFAGDDLRFKNLWTTLRYCVDTAEQESRIYRLFDTAYALKRIDDTLIIESDDNQTLVFKK